MKKRRFLLFFMILALGFGSGVCRAEEYSRISCVDNRAGCLLLQTVMSGSFDRYDPQDTLNGRVLSAVYPQLCSLTREDMDHFLQEFDEDEKNVTSRCRIATANCLWALLVTDPAFGSSYEPARGTLLLFLNPDGYDQAEEQMEEIREAMTEDTLSSLTAAVGAPQDFIRWLIQTAEWQDYRKAQEDGETQAG